tara:strand:+ start:193 stop:444 length:252 start_codon:yes stop_codon:yes gene_type:complete
MSKDKKPKEAKKEDFPFAKKTAERNTQAASSSSVRADFKSASILSRHIKALSDEEKIKFAAKYGIQYKDVSDIRGNAKRQYLD